MKDSSGLEITSNSEDVIDITEKFRYELLTMGGGVTDIINHAEKYPDSVILQLYNAALWLYGQSKESDANAETHLKNAHSFLEN